MEIELFPLFFSSFNKNSSSHIWFSLALFLFFDSVLNLNSFLSFITQSVFYRIVDKSLENIMLSRELVYGYSIN